MCKAVRLACNKWVELVPHNNLKEAINHPLTVVTEPVKVDLYSLKVDKDKADKVRAHKEVVSKDRAHKEVVGTFLQLLA